MTNRADPDQLASLKPTDLDLHSLQRQGISGFSRTGVEIDSKDPVRKSKKLFLLGNQFGVLIRSASVRHFNEYPQLKFHGEIRKISAVFG